MYEQIRKQLIQLEARYERVKNRGRFVLAGSIWLTYTYYMITAGLRAKIYALLTRYQV